MTKYRSGVGNITLSGTDGRRIGGQTWQKNGRVREHVGTINQPNSAEQARVKSFTTNASKAWGLDIGTLNRSLWIATAATDAWTTVDSLTGDTTKYNGFTLFMALNANIAFANQDAAVTNQAPVPKNLSGDSFVSSVVIDASAGTVVLAYTGSLGPDEIHVISFSAPQSPGKMTYRKSETSWLASDAAVSPLALGTAYVAKYGAISALTNYNVFYHVDAIDTVTGAKRTVGEDVAQIVT